MTADQKFTVTNYKGIDHVEISASHGELVIVAGPNGAGKSSFIDAFIELFAPLGIRGTPQPIRAGETNARVEYESTALDFKAVRTWTATGSQLAAFTLDGLKHKKPADLIAQMTGGLVFDAGRFLDMDDAKQLDAVLKKVELPFDLEKLDAEKAGAEHRRKEQGREVTRLKGALSSMPKPPADLPTEILSARELLDQIQAVRTEQERRAGQQRTLEQAASRLAVIDREIDALNEERRRVVEAQDQVQFEQLSQKPLPDTTKLSEQLSDIESTNDKIRAARTYADTAAELAAAEEAHAAEEERLKSVKQRKRDGLAAANWPDAGLGIDDGMLTLDGHPFKQVNTARREVAALRIATAGDPDLKLVVISNGDSLDDASLERVRELALERGFTVIIERDRDGSREVGFTLREGNLA